MNSIKKTLASMGEGDVVILDYQEETEVGMCEVKDCYHKVRWAVCAMSSVNDGVISEVCDDHMPEVARRFRDNVRRELSQ